MTGPADSRRVLAKVAGTGLSARTVDGTPVADRYELLVDLLAETGAGGRIPLFAEPEPSAQDGTRRWTTAVAGPVRRFADLDKAERTAVQRRLANDRRAIEASADLLDAGRRSKDAALLRAALASPGTAALFLVGDQPVLVAWGHDRLGARRAQPPSADTAPPQAAPSEAAPSEAAQPAAAEPTGPQPPTTPREPTGPTDGPAGAATGSAPSDDPGAAKPVTSTDGADTAAAATVVADDAPPPPRRPIFTRRRLGFLGWAISALLFAGLLVQLLGACPPWLPHCGTAPTTRLAVTEAETARQQLQGRYRQAQARLADLTCPVEPALAAAIPGAPPGSTGIPPASLSAEATGPSASVPMPGGGPPLPSDGDGAGSDRAPATDFAAAPSLPRFSLPALSPDRFDARIDAAGGTEAPGQISLIWEGDADLDLALICPNGDRVAWNVPTACGWRMDLEANAMAPLSGTPVENIVALDLDLLPPGRYRVAVTAFLARSAQFDPIGYAVRAQIGDRRLVGGGSVRQGDPSDIALTFDLPLDR